MLKGISLARRAYALLLNRLDDQQRASAGLIRIMPLGDSITDGYHVPGGYRIKLRQHLLAHRYAVDFAGSQKNGPSDLGDRDHEGHSGWRIDEIDARVRGWLARSRPHIVLLLAGTNDVVQCHRVATAPERLAKLIDKLFAQDAERRVILATLPPLSDPSMDALVRGFNARLPGIARARAAQGRRIVLVDMYNALTLDDLLDGVHPSRRGFDKMADAWYSELATMLDALAAGMSAEV